MDCGDNVGQSMVRVHEAGVIKFRKWNSAVEFSLPFLSIMGEPICRDGPKTRWRLQSIY